MSQRIPVLIVAVVITVLAGCATPSGERQKSWRCDGLTLYKKGVEGKVVFDGIGNEISTLFYVSGLDQRWSWNRFGTNYAVVLSQGSSGLIAHYYDFSFADEDGMAKSRAIFFDCSERYFTDIFTNAADSMADNRKEQP